MALELPPADFATFVLSLGTSAQMHLGLVSDSEGNDPPLNLPQAKYTIDVLAVLEEKTKGNLTPEEEQLLQSMLYELRVAFVAKKG